MTGIFVSYRRDDSPEFAIRLVESLVAVFGAAYVFRDLADRGPGEPVADVSGRHLPAVDVLLAVIGPHWLAAGADGRRCPDDVVAGELQAALAAGKPVWPVLVAGAALPAEADLPAPLCALAGRPAVVLSATDWQEDVARLIGALRAKVSPPPLPTPAHGLPWEIPAAVFVLAAALLLATSWIERLAEQRAASAARAPAAASEQPLAGGWTARIRYASGAEHDERFEFRVAGSVLEGTASYLGLPRRIEDGATSAGGQLEFVTRSEVVDGDNRRILIHRYRGRLDEAGIQFVLATTEGQSARPPLEFVARRAAP